MQMSLNHFPVAKGDQVICISDRDLSLIPYKRSQQPSSQSGLTSQFVDHKTGRAVNSKHPVGSSATNLPFPLHSEVQCNLPCNQSINCPLTVLLSPCRPARRRNSICWGIQEKEDGDSAPLAHQWQTRFIRFVQHLLFGLPVNT